MELTRSFYKGFVFVALIGILGACSNSELSESPTSAVANTYSTWHDPTRIPVCWTNLSQLSPALKNIAKNMQTLATEEFNRTNRIRFVGWEQCGPIRSEPEVRIYLDPSPRRGGIVGCSVVGPVSMRGVRFISNNCLGRGDHNMMVSSSHTSVIVHELGHALGLMHEHNRADRTGTCALTRNDQVIPDSRAFRYLTPYDSKSVMNYCFNSRGRLSDLDIEGLNAIYSGPAVGPISTKTGVRDQDPVVPNVPVDRPPQRPLDEPPQRPVDEPPPPPDKPVDHNPAPPIDREFKTLQLFGTFSCLTVNTSSSGGTSAVRSSPCNAGGNQNFQAKNADTSRFFPLISQASGQCLTVARGDGGSGETLVASRCNGSINQDWEFPRKGLLFFKLRNRATNHCINVQSDNSISLSDCDVSGSDFNWSWFW